MQEINKKTIWDYFHDNEDYPSDIAHNPIPYNTSWCYVSSTFLNGFINYVKPINAFIIDRYKLRDQDITDRKASVKKEGEWINFTGTKQELINKLVSKELSMYHTKLDSFGDDFVILAEIETSEQLKGKYMFFWFDMDCSDCSIGKFETEDTPELVSQSVREWLNKESSQNSEPPNENSDNGIFGYTEIPVSILNGWISF